MANKTPAKLGYWTFDVSNSQFGSPFSDVSITSTSSLQYINTQLVAHGFARGSGLSLEGLSREETDRTVKCLMGMLSQRVDDMSRAEDLATKLRTLSYEHERLLTMHRCAKDVAANAEKETSSQKSRTAAANRALQQVETAQKNTMAELQRTRSALLTLRTTHQQELKRKEKDLERTMERWSKISDSQMKLSSTRSGFQCTNLLADTGTETLGKGRGYLDVALDEAERSRKEIFEENERLRILLLGVVNNIQNALYNAENPTSDAARPEPLHLYNLFPLSPADFATAKVEELLEALRVALTRAASNTTLYTIPSPSNSTEHVTSHQVEVGELNATIQSLREELEHARAQVREEAQVLFDRFGENQPHFDRTIGEMSMELIGAPERDEERDRLMKIRQDLDTERSKFTLAAVKLGKEKAALEAERIQFLEEKRAWQVQQMLAELPPTPAPSQAHSTPPLFIEVSQASPKRSSRKSPMKAGASRKKVRISRKASVGISLSPRKAIIPAFETEVIPTDLMDAYEGKAEGAKSQPLLSGMFVLPPLSPLTSLPPQSGVLSALPLALQPQNGFPSVMVDDGDENPFAPNPFPQFNGTSSQPIMLEQMVGESDGIPVASPEPSPLPAPPAMQATPPLVFRRLFPMAKPLATHMNHAYSPVKPSPLSRILALANSPNSPTPLEFSLPNIEEVEKFMNDEKISESDVPMTFPPADSPLREKRLENNKRSAPQRLTAKDKCKGKAKEGPAKQKSDDFISAEKENAGRTRLKAQSHPIPTSVFSAPCVNAPGKPVAQSKSTTSIPAPSGAPNVVQKAPSSRLSKTSLPAVRSGVGSLKVGPRRVLVGSAEAAKLGRVDS